MPFNSLEFEEFSGLSAGSLICGTTTKGLNYALHTSEDLSEIKLAEKNRIELLKKLGYPYLVTLRQIHSGIVHIINNDNLDQFINNDRIEGDGLLTSLENVLIGVLTADCVPVFYTDFLNKFCGVVHAGWKGVGIKIHLKMIDRICSEYHVKIENIRVLIGPHIGNCCYEVKKDLVDQLETEFYRYRNGGIFLDLESIITGDLIRRGVEERNIIKTGFCTKCSENPAFYSYRNGEKTGRNLSFIGISG